MDKLIDLIKNNPDQINALAAVCALVVSLLSIFLTIYTLWLQRRHNFKSLTPIASILIGDYENLLEVKLRNTGIGPLIIERFTALNGNQGKDDVVSWAPSLPNGIYWSTFTENINGWCISPNQDVILIQLQGDSNERGFATLRDEVRRALSRLTIKVEYKDIYDRNMPTKERNLKWFARHFPEEDVQKSKKEG